MSALPPKADILPHLADVRFVPTADLPATGVAQPIQKLFRRDQIGGAKSLREAVVDRLKAGDGLGLTVLVAQQAREARRGAQLPRQRRLLVRKIERLPEEVLRRFRDGRSGLQQQELTP